MRTRMIIIAGLVVLIAAFALMDGTQNEHNSAAMAISWKKFDEAVLLAKRENKKIVVDVYTDWCSWCKRMDKDVYGNSAVSEILAKNFIAVKLNPELSEQVTYDGKTMTNSNFAQNFGVTGYPTTLFLDAEGKPITILPGFVEHKEFQSILSYIGENHYKTMNYDTYRSSKPQQ